MEVRSLASATRSSIAGVSHHQHRDRRSSLQIWWVRGRIRQRLQHGRNRPGRWDVVSKYPQCQRDGTHACLLGLASTIRKDAELCDGHGQAAVATQLRRSSRGRRAAGVASPLTAVQQCLRLLRTYGTFSHGGRLNRTAPCTRHFPTSWASQCLRNVVFKCCHN